MDTTEREGLYSIDWTKGQADFREGKEEKLKPSAERLSSTVERLGGEGEAKTGAESGMKGLDMASATAFLALGT